MNHPQHGLDIAKWAEYLLAGVDERRELAPITKDVENLSIDDAYAIQAALLEMQLERGDTLAGEFAFSLGFSLGVLFLGLLYRGVETQRGWRSLGLLLAFIGICHPIAFLNATAPGLFFLMSRRHFVLERTDDGLVVVDQGSANGTWVNGQRIKRSPLRHGDVLQAGRTSFVFLEH